jgi:predicted Zn-dependent peptidase
MHKIQRLKNGLRYITIPISGTNTATILVMVGTGSKYENKYNNGISHFLEHMFFKGTKKRPNTLAISGELDSIGAEFNAFTSKEYTGYWVKADKEKIELAMDIVSDIFLNSKLDKKEIEKEKGVIIEEINMYQDNPIMYIEDLFEECLYGDSPAGWDTLGTKRNVLKLQRKDLINYLSSQYGSQNTIICLAGNLGRSASLIEKYFFKLKKSDPRSGSRTCFQDKQHVVEKQSKPQIKIHYKKTDQAHLSLGVRTFPINHKDEYIVKILSILLGGSMSSRLFLELREKRGLAYYVRTQAEFYTDSGYLTTQAGVPVDKLPKAIKVILNEYSKLKKELVKEKELRRIKDLFKGRLTIQLEASDLVASWYARQTILRGQALTPDEFINKVFKVKPKDIQRVAKEIFVNKGLNLAVIGPYKKLDLRLKI